MQSSHSVVCEPEKNKKSQIINKKRCSRGLRARASVALDCVKLCFVCVGMYDTDRTTVDSMIMRVLPLLLLFCFLTVQSLFYISFLWGTPPAPPFFPASFLTVYKAFFVFLFLWGLGVLGHCHNWPTTGHKSATRPPPKKT